MVFSNHAIERLEERFGYKETNITDIQSILNNPRACTQLNHRHFRGLHIKFKYKGEHIVAVIKNNVVVTFKFTEIDYIKKGKEEKRKRPLMSGWIS